MKTSTRIRRIKRPIDFRMDGSSICQMLTLDQIFLVCATVLQERKLVVISSKLSDLSALFDAIESLLFPMTWLHTFIPALPTTMTAFLEAPTPYLIGVLLDSCLYNMDNVSVDQQNAPDSFRYDRDCLVLRLNSANGKGKVVKYLIGINV